MFLYCGVLVGVDCCGLCLLLDYCLVVMFACILRCLFVAVVYVLFFDLRMSLLVDVLIGLGNGVDCVILYVML